MNIFYLAENGKILDSSHTGVIENKFNIFLHPPRSYLFRILELAPFPFVQFPLNIQRKWKFNLEIDDSWSDPNWNEWRGNIDNQSLYTCEKKELLETEFGTLSCSVIISDSNNEAGDSSLVAYYNMDYGFVMLKYHTIDNSNLILKRVKK